MERPVRWIAALAAASVLAAGPSEAPLGYSSMLRLSPLRWSRKVYAGSSSRLRR